MLKKVKSNKEWCSAIFRYLIMNPDKAQELNFKSEYVSDSEKIVKLFDSAYELASVSKMPYTKRMLCLAYFSRVRPEYYELYNDPTVQDVKARAEMMNEKSLIESYYDLSVEMGQTLGDDFTYGLARELVYEQSAAHIYNYYQVEFLKLNDEDRSIEEINHILRTSFDSLVEKYPLPEDSSSTYISPFDSRLMIKVNDKIFTSSSPLLNTMLSGGFTSQSVCGFLTKTAGGKSTLLFSLAADFIRNGYNVCFVNLEMNDYETNSRIISAVTGVPYKNLLANLQNEEFMADVREKWDDVAVGKYAMLSNRGKDFSKRNDARWLRNSVHALENKLARSLDRNGFKFDIIIIDYLYLMDACKTLLRNSRSDELYRQVTVEVHEFAQNDDYCVVTVFQGNREAERKLGAGEKFGLAEAGDSYAAFRDIEYAFALSRYSDVLDDKDGCLIEPLKTRHYDGERYGIYMPYLSQTMSYTISESEFIDMDDSSSNKDVSKIKKSKSSKPLEVTDVLKADPELKLIVGGTIRSVCMASKVVKNAAQQYSVIDAFAKLGWGKPKRAKDFTNPDYDYMSKKVREAIKKALAIKESGQTPEQPVVGINQFDIFSI